MEQFSPVRWLQNILSCCNPAEYGDCPGVVCWVIFPSSEMWWGIFFFYWRTTSCWLSVSVVFFLSALLAYWFRLNEFLKSVLVTVTCTTSHTRWNDFSAWGDISTRVTLQIKHNGSLQVAICFNKLISTGTIHSIANSVSKIFPVNALMCPSDCYYIACGNGKHFPKEIVKKKVHLVERCSQLVCLKMLAGLTMKMHK